MVGHHVQQLGMYIQNKNKTQDATHANNRELQCNFLYPSDTLLFLLINEENKC